MSGETGGRPDREWPRALALLALAFGLSIIRPSVLVGVPLVILVAVLPAPRLGAVVVGLFVAFLVFGGMPGEGLWYVERGWAILIGGWFGALSVRWPRARLFTRALGSVAGALAVTVALLSVRPGAWEVLDWLVAERLRAGVAVGLEAMRLMSGEGGTLSPALVLAVQRALDFQLQVFPALLALASLAALAFTWWMYTGLGHGASRALAPLREFRFSDQLVWILIAGMALVLAGTGDALNRAGANALVFMGALYALRGVAVVLFASGGVSFFGGVLLLLGVLLVAPVLFALALAIGLGDTWFDLRSRWSRLTA